MTRLLLHLDSLKKIACIVLIVLVSNIGFSQNQNALIHLKNGRTLQGYVDITNSGNIKYSVNEESKEQKTFTYKDVKQLDLFHNEDIIVFLYKNINDLSKSPDFKLMEVILLGKVSLYRVHNFGSYDGGGVPYNNQGFSYGGSGNYGGRYSINNYYVSKNGGITEKLATTGTLFTKSFKKSASEYFSDCPELVQKIQDYTFTKKDIEQMVLFYNESCGSL